MQERVRQFVRRRIAPIGAPGAFVLALFLTSAWLEMGPLRAPASPWDVVVTTVTFIAILLVLFLLLFQLREPDLPEAGERSREEAISPGFHF